MSSFNKIILFTMIGALGFCAVARADGVAGQAAVNEIVAEALPTSDGGEKLVNVNEADDAKLSSPSAPAPQVSRLGSVTQGLKNVFIGAGSATSRALQNLRGYFGRSAGNAAATGGQMARSISDRKLDYSAESSEAGDGEQGEDKQASATEAELETEAELAAESEPEPATESEPEPAAESEPAAEAELETEAELAAESEPATEDASEISNSADSKAVEQEEKVEEAAKAEEGKADEKDAADERE